MHTVRDGTSPEEGPGEHKRQASADVHQLAAGPLHEYTPTKEAAAAAEAA
jgi:hypothetical protein